jgi:hypothetical protein
MKNKYTLLLLTLFISFSSCRNTQEDGFRSSLSDAGKDEKSICAFCGKETNWRDAYYWIINDNLSPEDKLSILQVGTSESFSDENGEIHKGVGSEMPYYNNGKYLKGVFCSYQCAQNDSNSKEQNSNSESNNTEKCNTCGINLITPTSRNCTWCNNLFDGWSPGEQDCSMLVECSDKIKKEAQEQDSDAFIAKAVLGSIEIHNGCTWRVNDNEHFCSLKCMNEYKESRY